MSFLYDAFGLNRWLFTKLNAPQGDMAQSAVLIADLVGDFDVVHYYLLAFMICALIGIAFKQSRQRRAYLGKWVRFLTSWLGATTCCFVIVHLLKYFAAMPRPFASLANGEFNMIATLDKTVFAAASFPSGHAAFSACLAASLWPYLDRFGKAAACCFALWIGWSRIAAGLHFPVDVIVGMLIGSICGIAAYKVCTRFRPTVMKAKA